MARFYNPIHDGSQGIPGPQGIQGEQGEQGTQGIQGVQGETGAALTVLGSYPDRVAFDAASLTGNAGEAWLIISDGSLLVWNVLTNVWDDAGDLQGPQGIQGEQGIQGVQGLQGIQGIQGVKGDTGLTGAKGDQGIQGIQGVKGDTGATGAAGGFGYYGSFFDELDQTGTNGSIQAMRVRTTDFSNGVTANGTNHTQLTMAHAGKYNIAFSAQIHQTNSSSIVNIWLAKNGTAMEWTNTKCAITANNPYYVAAWNFFVDAAANDYYEIMWSADSANAILEAEAAVGSGATLHPAVPSVIITVNQVG
jgi:hypothetical protein